MSLGSLSAGWPSGELEDSGKQTKSPRRYQGLVRGEAHIVWMTGNPVRLIGERAGALEGRREVVRSLETRNPSVLESFLSTLKVASSSEKEGRDRRQAQLIPSVCYFLFPAGFAAISPSLPE